MALAVSQSPTLAELKVAHKQACQEYHRRYGTLRPPRAMKKKRRRPAEQEQIDHYNRMQEAKERLQLALHREIPCILLTVREGAAWCQGIGSHCRKRAGAACRRDGGVYCGAASPTHDFRGDRVICRHRLSDSGPRPECRTCEGMPRHPYVPPTNLTRYDNDRLTPPSIMCRLYEPRPLAEDEYLAMVMPFEGRDYSEPVLKLRRVGDGHLPILRTCDHPSSTVHFPAPPRCHCIDGIPVSSEWFGRVVSELAQKQAAGQLPEVMVYHGSYVEGRHEGVAPLFAYRPQHHGPAAGAYAQLIRQELSGDDRHRAVPRCYALKRHYGEQLAKGIARPVPMPAAEERPEGLLAMQRQRCLACQHYRAGCRMAAAVAEADSGQASPDPHLQRWMALPCSDADPHGAHLKTPQEAAEAIAAYQAAEQRKTVSAFVAARAKAQRTQPAHERRQAVEAEGAALATRAAVLAAARQAGEELMAAGYESVGPYQWHRSLAEDFHRERLSSALDWTISAERGITTSILIPAPHQLASNGLITDLVRAASGDPIPPRLGDDGTAKLLRSVGEGWIRPTADGLLLETYRLSPEARCTLLLMLRRSVLGEVVYWPSRPQDATLTVSHWGQHRQSGREVAAYLKDTFAWPRLIWEGSWTELSPDALTEAIRRKRRS